jgi:hypothetical protein
LPEILIIVKESSNLKMRVDNSSEENKQESSQSESQENDDYGRRKPQKTPIGDFKYLGNGRVRSKDFPITFVTVFLIMVPSVIYLIAM